MKTTVFKGDLTTIYQKLLLVVDMKSFQLTTRAQCGEASVAYSSSCEPRICL